MKTLKTMLFGTATSLIAFAAEDETGAGATVLDEGSTGTAEAPAAEAPAEAPAKEEKPKRDPLREQNGVSEPAPGTKTRRVWDIASEISAEKKRPATRKEVIAQGEAESINKATITTQFGRWCKFYAVSADDRKAVRDAEREAKAAADKEAADAAKAAAAAAEPATTETTTAEE